MSHRLPHLEQSVGIAAVVLSPFALLYGLGWRLYAGLYRSGLKKAKAPHSPTIVVGNFTVGGTGKTPFTCWLVSCLQDLGREVVISASGYGSDASASATIAPEGPLKASDWGDEPAYYRWSMPKIPLIVGRDRVRAAEICAEHFPHAVLLLDDGFQHLPLKTDLSIILDPPDNLNSLCLPAGPYREPRSSGKKRAGLVLPGDFELVRIGPIFLDAEAKLAKEPLPQDIQILCAIGSPWRFQDMMEANEFNVVRARFLEDHNKLDSLALFSSFDPRLPIVVTAKDWVKLRQRGDLSRFEIWIVDYRVRVEPENKFRAWLKERLNEIETQRT